MKALIVDDETPARQRLKRLLEKYHDVEVIGEAANGIAALEKVEQLKPDVAFLDIEMPELDGLGVAEALRENGPAIVFITAYNEHALRAFDVCAVDYLVKPIVDSRLDAAIDKLRARKSSKFGAPDIAKLMESLRGISSTKKLAVRCGAKYVVFDSTKISAILARDHYAAIVVDGRDLLADDSLDTLASRLGGDQFMRIHRSALINIDYLKELEREVTGNM